MALNSYKASNLSKYYDPDFAQTVSDTIAPIKEAGTSGSEGLKQALLSAPIASTGSKRENKKSPLSKIVDILGATGGFVMNPIYNATNAEGEPDVSSWELLKEGWNNEGFLSTLENVGEKSKRASDVFTNLFGEQQEADQPYTLESLFKGQKGALDLRDIAEFGTDVAFDPLTYLTLGAGSVGKAGLKAATKEADDIAKEVLEQTGRQIETKASKNVYKDVPEQVRQANLAAGKTAEEATKAAKASAQRIQNAAKTSRKTAQNAILSVDVPFTRYTKQFGNIANLPIIGKYLVKNPRTITKRGAEALVDNMNRLNIDSATQADVIGRYLQDAGIVVRGTDRDSLIEAASNLSTDAYQDIVTRIRGAEKTNLPVTMASSLMRELAGNAQTTQDAVADILKNLPDGASAEDIAKALQQAIRTDLPEKVKDMPADVAKLVAQVGALEKTGVTDELYESVKQALQASNKDDVIKDLTERISKAEQKFAFEQGIALDRSLADNVRKIIGEQSPASRLVDKANFYLQRIINSNLPQFPALPKNADKMYNDVFNALFAGDADALGDLIKSNPKSAIRRLRQIITDLKSAAPDLGAGYQQVSGFKNLSLDKLKTLKNVPQSLKDATEIIAKSIEEGKGKLVELQKKARDNVNVERQRIRQVNKAYETAVEKLQKMGTPRPRFSRDLEPAFDGVEWVEDIGRSRFGAWISDRFLYAFNPRSFGSGDSWIDWLSHRITDADTKRYSNAKKMEGELGLIQQVAKDLTEKEMTDVQYLIERVFPARTLDDEAKQAIEAVQKSGKSADEIEEAILKIKEESFLRSRGYSQEIIDRMRTFAKAVDNFLNEIGREDLKVGLLQEMRRNYFPHAIKVTDEMIEALKDRYKNDTTLAQLFDTGIRTSEQTLRGRSATMSSSKRRDTFQSFAEIDDYLDNLGREIEAKRLNGEDVSELEAKKKDIENLFERNTLQALAARAFQSIRARSMRELYEQFVEDGVITRVNPNDKDFVPLYAAEVGQLGLRPILDIEPKVKKLDKDGKEIEVDNKVIIYMHKDILHGLKQMNRMFTDKDLSNAIQHINDVINVWKYTTTVLVPRHYLNNFIGNIFNNAIVGVDLQSYKQSSKLLSKFGKEPESLTPEEREIIDQAFDHGVIGQGFTADFIRDSPFHAADSWLKQNVVTPLDKTAYVKFMRGFGERSDDFTRLALYLHTLKTTGSVEIAASTVRKYLFNYHELTNTDKVIRAIGMPFWSWTKNNVPLQIMTLLTQPRYVQTVASLREATFDDSEYPEYVKEGYIVIDGKPYPLTLPVQDINLPFEPMRTLATSANPFVKAPFELTANEYLYTGAPIDKEAAKINSTDYSTEAYYKYLMKNMGIVGNVTYSFFPVGDDKAKSVADFATALITGNPYEPKN